MLHRVHSTLDKDATSNFCNTKFTLYHFPFPGFSIGSGKPRPSILEQASQLNPVLGLNNMARLLVRLIVQGVVDDLFGTTRILVGLED
jgi:hypothetical protein